MTETNTAQVSEQQDTPHVALTPAEQLERAGEAAVEVEHEGDGNMEAGGDTHVVAVSTPSKVRFILIVDEDHEMGVMSAIGEYCTEQGTKVKLERVEEIDDKGRPVQQADPDQVRKVRNGTARVVYKVIDRMKGVSPEQEIIRTYLLANGPRSQADITRDLHIPTKSAQSHIHKMRTEQVIESIEA